MTKTNFEYEVVNPQKFNLFFSLIFCIHFVTKSNGKNDKFFGFTILQEKTAPLFHSNLKITFVSECFDVVFLEIIIFCCVLKIKFKTARHRIFSSLSFCVIQKPFFLRLCDI